MATFDPIRKFISIAVADVVEAFNTLINEINERLIDLGQASAAAVAAVTAALAAHVSDHDNPHATTAAQVGAYTQAQVNTLISTAGFPVYVYALQSSLFANLTPAAPAFGQVYADGVNNGSFIKVGGTGTGSWSKFSNATIPALDSRTTVLELAHSALVDVPLLAAGTLAANALLPGGWSSPAGDTTITQSFWGSANTRYLIGPDNNITISATTVQACRDQEIDLWTRVGTAYLRLDSAGKAIYFNMNGDMGTLTIGVIGSAPSGTPLILQTITLSTIPGYDGTATAGTVFTFGVSGFDVYAKFNGVEFVRFKQLFQIASGRIAVKSLNTTGYRFLIARFLPDTPLQSDTYHNIVNMFDFGARDYTAKGSITAAGFDLTLLSNPGFAVGDKVIVEIGMEPGAGRPGSIGVGGAWPTKSYANIAAMNADSGQAANTYAWLVDTGRVYQYVSSAWAIIPATSFYITNANPLSLRATITAINGLVLTLDTAAQVTVSNANVIFDNTTIASLVTGPLASAPYYTLLPTQLEVVWNAGEFGFSLGLDFRFRSSWVLSGSGREVTTLYSPRGVPSMTILNSQSNNSAVKDLHLKGNARLTGYGIFFISQTALPGNGATYPRGIFMSVCTGCVVRDCFVTDAWQAAVGVSGGSNNWAYNTDVFLTDGLAQYIQWMFEWADTTGGGFEDVAVFSPIATAGFEAFRSTGVTMRRIRGVNAAVSVNSSGGWYIDEPNLRFTENCLATNGSFAASVPAININSNIVPPSPDMELGGTIRYPRIIQEGYINDTQNNLLAIVVNFYNPNVTIIGSYDGVQTFHADVIQAPDAPLTGTNFRGSTGVNAVGANCLVQNIRVIGKSQFEIAGTGYRNISATLGSITNNVADSVGGGAPVTGNRTNAQYGTGP